MAREDFVQEAGMTGMVFYKEHFATAWRWARPEAGSQPTGYLPEVLPRCGAQGGGERYVLRQKRQDLAPEWP